MKLCCVFPGKADFILTDEKGGFLTKCGSFYLNETLAAIGVKRKNIKTEAITLALGHMFNFICKPGLAQGSQTKMFETDHERFSRKAQ